MSDPVFELPLEAVNMLPRELARHTQTDATPDAEEAIAWGEAAFAAASQIPTISDDPTLRGEVSRNIVLRCELAGKPTDEVDHWLQESLATLDPISDGLQGYLRNTSSRERIDRERAATLFVGGRILHHQISLGRAEHTTRSVRLYFQTGDSKLALQHWPRTRWDRYATMSARHRAAFEADDSIEGTKNSTAVSMAIRGIWRALRAEHEDDTVEQHRDFVKKQMGANALVGLVAITNPVRGSLGVSRVNRWARSKVEMGRPQETFR